MVARLVLCGLVVFAQNLFASPVSTNNYVQLSLDVQLTEKEQQYLRLKKKLTHCETPYWMPFSNNESGKHIGITADYVSIFSNVLDIPIEYVPTYSWSETLHKLESRECDFISAIVDRPSRHTYLDFTQGYIDASLVLATSSDAPRINNLNALYGKTIGVVKGYASASYIQENFPNLVLREIDSLDQGLKLVAEKQIYGLVGTLGVLVYRIQNHYFQTLKINGTFTNKWMLSVGTRSDKPILNSIMSKAVSSIPNETHQLIFSNWISESVLDADVKDLTLNELDFIAKHPTIRFRVRSNRAPFEYEVNGEAHGLAVDYIKHIAKRAGFRAEFVTVDQAPNEVINELKKENPRFDTFAYWVASDKRRDTFNFGDVYLKWFNV